MTTHLNTMKQTKMIRVHRGTYHRFQGYNVEKDPSRKLFDVDSNDEAYMSISDCQKHKLRIR